MTTLTILVWIILVAALAGAGASQARRLKRNRAALDTFRRRAAAERILQRRGYQR